MGLLRLLLPPGRAYRRAAAAVLRQTVGPEMSRAILAEMVTRHVRTRTRHSFGVNLLLRYFDWSRALYAAALDAALPRETAGRLIEETHWALFGPVFRPLFRLSRVRSRSVRTRVRWMLDLSFRTVFTAPFERRTLDERTGVAFDVLRCPLAEYFREHGTPELTRHAACSMDHRMAAAWGVDFARTGTIAEGAAFCDFRYRIDPHATA